MFKIIVVAVIAVCTSAQYGDERRLNGERRSFRVNSEELLVSPGNPEESLRVSPRHRNPENIGGFQNANFAPHDGRLKTNLDVRVVTDSGQNPRRRVESPYVEEGAAFSRPEGQYDVHSSQGRVDYLPDDDRFNVNENRRTEIQNYDTQYEERLEERPSYNQRNQNINDSNNDRQGNNGQSETRNVNNNQNRFNNQNTPKVHHQRDGNNERVNLEQNTGDQNTDNSAHNYNQDRLNDTNTQITNDGQHQLNTRLNKQTNNQNRFNSQNPQQTNRNSNQNERIPNSGTNLDETVSKIDSNSRKIADKVNNRENYDREAMDREINNQITKMIFDESVQPELTTKKTTKTTQDNELPSRSNTGKKDDRWIWSDGSELNATTSPPTNPTVDDRAAFTGDQCPTGKTRFNNVCVTVDP